MAKSEIPNIVVQSGGGGTNNCCNMEQQQHHQYVSGRPSRLEKQEEFEVEEEAAVYNMPSTVTIQIEDGGSGPDDNSDGCGVEYGASEAKMESPESGTASETSTSGKGEGSADGKLDRSKVPSQRVKLLVRSQAVHDDASPPPDLETVITNTNMLSVTNAPAFATQTQSKSSNKNRLGRQGSSQGSQGSTESSSGLSRDSSTETYTDSTGVDLQQFIIETLHKNQKDRIMMLKIEQDLTALVKDPKRHSMKFAQMSSYNRMLVHRVAAFFGLDHYVDANGTSVIVNKTKNTRIPDARFQDYCRDELLPEEPKKSILKRDSISFEEGKEKSPERQSSTDSRRSKSFEEREEEYEKARARIFKDEGLGESPISRRSSQEDIRWPSSDTRPWSSTDSDSSGRPLGAKGGSSFETEGAQIGVIKAERPVALLTKAESESKELLFPARMVRPVMTKASSFGGISVLTREGSGGKSITPKITKAESFNVTTLSGSSSACSMMPSQVPVSSTPSPSLLVTSTVGMPTTCPSQFVAASVPQTFPVVAGQPTQLQIPIQQFSSQVSGWPVGNREVPVSDYGNQATVGQQFSVWPVSSAPDVMFPGGVVINPQSGAPFVNLDNVYRYKAPPSASGQTIMLASYQPIAIQPSNQVPISSHVSTVSPSTQQPPTAHQATPSNLQLSVTPQQQQQQQQQHQQQQQQHQQQQQPQQQAVQIPQTPTVVYVPYITSQIPTSLVPQASLGGGSAPQVQQLQQQQQPPAPHQTQMMGEQRTYAVNPNSGSVEQLSPQLSGLSLIPPQVPQLQESASSGRNLVNIDPASSPQSYVVPTFKSQGFVNPQGSIAPFPVYYMQQVQQASNVHPVRYVFPASPPVAQQVAPGPGNSVGMSGQIVSDVQSHIVTQASSQMTGSQYLPGYPILALSQPGDTSGTSTFISYTLASQTAAITTTTSVLVPSSPMSMPIYPYGSMVIGNLNNSNTGQTSFTPPVTTQPTQTPTYVQTPVAVQTPTALPMYVITTTSAQAPIAQSQVGSTTPFASFRSQSLPSAPSSGSTSAVLNPQLSGNSSAVGYAIYATQQLPNAAIVTQSTTVAAQSGQSSQSVAAQMAPAILTTFQVLRPNVPLVRNVRTGSSPPTSQNIITQYTSQPASANKVPLSFPLVKQASDPGVDCYGLINGRAEQSKGSRTNQLQAMASTSCRPASGLVCPRGIPVMQDLCLIGHPLQHHHFNPLMLSQQRPIARFMHPQSTSSTTNRPPKNRGKRNKGNQPTSSSVSNGSRNGTSFLSAHDLNAGNVLEIEGLPEGMKRSEIERYLEPATCHGAKIQFLDSESGNQLTSETDFVVCSRHLVVAVFESDTAAQSALLGIKTPKFQLRPVRQSTKDVTKKKYS